MKPMKPVKAWGSFSKEGQLASVSDSGEEASVALPCGGYLLPVTITDARWMTRAEFEGGGIEQLDTDGLCHIVYKGNVRRAICVNDGSYLAYQFLHGTGLYMSECVTHVQLIHAPSAPTEGE